MARSKKTAPEAETPETLEVPEDTKTTVQDEQLRLQQAEQRLANKFGNKIVPGSIRRETDGRWSGKLTVEIYTKGLDGQLDGFTRRVATSDVFQVHHTEEVTSALRKLNAKARRAKVKEVLAS